MSNRLVFYTDGSSSIISGLCGWSVIARFNDREIKACGWAKGTNQFAELYAVVYILRILPVNIAALIVSDSEYAIKSLTTWRNKWERNGFIGTNGHIITNVNLVKERHKLLDYGRLVEFRHVRGHTGVAGNELADKLAKAARFLGEGRLTKSQVDGMLIMENGRLL